MLEYSVPVEHHIRITQDPAELFTLSIGMLGDLAAAINRQELDLEIVNELRNSLIFSARFFDSFLQSKLNQTLDPYLLLVGSASYYLSDLPGSASVLAWEVDENFPDLGACGLENLLFWLLRGNTARDFGGAEGTLGNYIDVVFKGLVRFLNSGDGEAQLIGYADELRKAVYEFGSPRQLLLGDITVAVIRRKIENSSWRALPVYSGLSREKWSFVLRKCVFRRT
tara:strand:- start:24 stop:698 length:675 start_codon:yes stop_codon:yes gene_type:complete